MFFFARAIASRSSLTEGGSVGGKVGGGVEGRVEYILSIVLLIK
jgi:hypothetical protein